VTRGGYAASSSRKILYAGNVSEQTDMRLRRVILAVVAAGVLVTVGGLAWAWRPAIAPTSAKQTISDRKTIDRGAELAAIGNCSDCHTKDVGVPYGGGRALPTPFGTIYASNLTPDRETGIGTWSEEAFRRAMREGVDREGRQLYPAFPYDHFTKATDEDIHALYSFLMSIPAIHNVIPANQLSFPFSFRPIIAGWKVLFLSQAPLENDASKSAQWNRGRYLVEGLGHCGSCHTPRNALGGEEKGSLYAGGVAEGWNAPPLNASLVTTHHWTVDQLAEYLSTGWHKLHGAAAGPMADVARNLGQASKDEVHAIATYVASLSSPDNKTAIITDNGAKSEPADIVAIYTGACAKCHNGRNDVGPSKALSLSLSTAVQQADPANTIRVILHGIQSYRTGGGPYMPAFDTILTDKQIADIAQYIRERYTNQPQWADIKTEVIKARQEAQP
jgi:mono/diheme cytochrome c family protein